MRRKRKFNVVARVDKAIRGAAGSVVAVLNRLTLSSGDKGNRLQPSSDGRTVAAEQAITAAQTKHVIVTLPKGDEPRMKKPDSNRWNITLGRREKIIKGRQ